MKSKSRRYATEVKVGLFLFVEGEGNDWTEKGHVRAYIVYTIYVYIGRKNAKTVLEMVQRSRSYLYPCRLRETTI